LLDKFATVVRATVKGSLLVAAIQGCWAAGVLVPGHAAVRCCGRC
jgi:hypothetical protein